MPNIVHPKVSAAFFAGALVTVVLGLISEVTGWSPDPEWVAGLTTLVAIAAGWIMPNHFDQDPPAGPTP